MAWLSRVNFIASDTLSFSDINNLGNDIRAWGGNVNGGGYVLSNVVLSASAGTMATVTGGTGAASTLTLQSTSGAGTSDAIIFKTASQSERMRILTGGNVGIGTASPGAPLHVFGNTSNEIARFQPSSASSNARGYISLYTTNPNYWWEISNQDSAGTGSQNCISFLERSGTAAQSRLFLEQGGNVGIGTMAPGGTLPGGMTAGAKVLEVRGSGVNDVGLFLRRSDGVTGLDIWHDSSSDANYDSRFVNIFSSSAFAFYNGTTQQLRITSGGNVGIGTMAAPAYKLEVSTDSAGKPGVGGLWTVVSDERIKTDITPADLDRCYEIVKSVPLKHFGFAPGVYTDDQINDKHSLGWIAQDVQKVFSKAVSVKPFTLNTEIPDGTEEYTEQDFTLETVEKTETSIQVIDGKPVQVSKVVTSENKVLLFDSVDVVDEAGAVVMDGDKPLTYQMPRMVTKTRNKVRHDVIEDCLDLNGGQMIAALYGAVQAIINKLEVLTARN
jgi:hypothetical protein